MPQPHVHIPTTHDVDDHSDMVTDTEQLVSDVSQLAAAIRDQEVANEEPCQDIAEARGELDILCDLAAACN